MFLIGQKNQNDLPFLIHEYGEGEEGSCQEGDMERWSVYQGVLINSSVMRIEAALMPFTTLQDQIKPNSQQRGWVGKSESI